MSKKIIYLDDAIDAIKALWDGAPSAQHVSAMFDCEDALQALPSAQPEKVKCKKCRYVYYDKEFDNYWCNRMSDPFKVEEDGFCKWGK